MHRLRIIISQRHRNQVHVQGEEKRPPRIRTTTRCLSHRSGPSMENPDIWRDVLQLLSRGNRRRKEDRSRRVHKPRDPHQDRRVSRRTLKKKSSRRSARNITWSYAKACSSTTACQPLSSSSTYLPIKRELTTPSSLKTRGNSKRLPTSATRSTYTSKKKKSARG